jgi:hypothetical protein
MTARRRPLLRAIPALLSTVLLVSGAACGREPVSALPLEFQIRSDVPYVRGVIVEKRSTDTGGTTIHVRHQGGDPAMVTDAIVSLPDKLLLRWEDGAPAAPADLRLGRRVTVWVTGPELRSLPPQVTGSAILLAR